MRSLVLFIFIFCNSARAATFPTARQVCLQSVEETFRLIVNCSWKTMEPEFRQTRDDQDNYICKGRLVCANIDPFLTNFPFELKVATCNNGPQPCVNFTGRCRTSMKEKEIENCNNLQPDSHRYEPGPPI